jgi:hypothetical protein
VNPKALLLVPLTITLAAPVLPQEATEPEPAEIVVEPRELTLEVGQKARLTATVKDKDGNRLESTVVFYSRNHRAVGVNAAGDVEAFLPGTQTLVALVPKYSDDLRLQPEAKLEAEITVTVPKPPVKSVTFSSIPSRFFAGTVVAAAAAEVVDVSGARRSDVSVGFSSGTPDVARMDELGTLTLLKPGNARLLATAETVTGTMDIEVVPDPAVTFELEAGAKKARTGDVVAFTAIARDKDGRAIEDYPVQFAASGRPAETIIAPGATAFIEPDGKFVAERPGVYTIVATSGGRTARASIEILPRDVRRDVEVVGRGPVRDRHTSDLWVWQAPDGRDYAITGTWGADGHAYIWDVTDPKNINLVDMVRVDARTVNDVKISEDGAVAVISREGASNRKNGFVVLDVSRPQEGVRILSRFDDQLTGGVHNIFIYKNHVYALSNGRRYDIVNIEDPVKPVRVGRFELDTPWHAIHDVWVVDGIAYSSNWDDGVVAVDVGGGGKGGAPNKPIRLASYTWPSGWNHAAFPYRSKSTGKFYVFAGDEAFPYPRENSMQLSAEKLKKMPERAAGWIHVIEWDQWEHPREVARYHVPEAGTHNLWVEDDIMYVAYYNGGLRVVDVSGELRGDLYKQGREIAFWMPYDPEGFVPNAPMVWGPQPYKGNIFLADHNSGLWVVRLRSKEETKARNLGEPQ